MKFYLIYTNECAIIEQTNGGASMEENIQAVDVISVCSASGDVQPLRLRVADASEELFRIDIEEILSIKEIPYVGAEATVYLCRARAWDRRWLVELKYSMRSHTWYLLRKIRG